MITGKYRAIPRINKGYLSPDPNGQYYNTPNLGKSATMIGQFAYGKGRYPREGKIRLDVLLINNDESDRI